MSDADMGKFRCEWEVRQWNRQHPVGTGVRVQLLDGRSCKTKTRSEAKVFNDANQDSVAGVFLEGCEEAIPLDACTPEIPKELEFLQEHFSAEDVRRHLAHVRTGDLEIAFFKLARHWEYQTENVTEAEARIFRHCAKQLKQRTENLKIDLIFLQAIIKNAPHLLLPPDE